MMRFRICLQYLYEQYRMQFYSSVVILIDMLSGIVWIHLLCLNSELQVTSVYRVSSVVWWCGLTCVYSAAPATAGDTDTDTEPGCRQWGCRHHVDRPRGHLPRPHLGGAAGEGAGQDAGCRTPGPPGRHGAAYIYNLYSISISIMSI